MKGVWITTVYNQDWPSSSSKGNVEIQKSEFINILEDVMSLGIDTIVVQIRPKSDALYKSSINPWSDILTGVQGKNPGYDPLEFILEESHKRNIKVHGIHIELQLVELIYQYCQKIILQGIILKQL